MKTFDKLYEYKTYMFKVQVLINNARDIQYGGLKHHEVISSSMGPDNYYTKGYASNQNLAERIKEHEAMIKDYVDNNRLKITPIEKMVMDLGFNVVK